MYLLFWRGANLSSMTAGVGPLVDVLVNDMEGMDSWCEQGVMSRLLNYINYHDIIRLQLIK